MKLLLLQQVELQQDLPDGVEYSLNPSLLHPSVKIHCISILGRLKASVEVRATHQFMHLFDFAVDHSFASLVFCLFSNHFKATLDSRGIEQMFG